MKTLRVVRDDAALHLDEELSAPELVGARGGVMLSDRRKIQSTDLYRIEGGAAALHDGERRVASVVILDNPRS